MTINYYYVNQSKKKKSGSSHFQLIRTVKTSFKNKNVASRMRTHPLTLYNQSQSKRNKLNYTHMVSYNIQLFSPVGFFITKTILHLQVTNTCEDQVYYWTPSLLSLLSLSPKPKFKLFKYQKSNET